jgi:hypothetical protein|tara:strand:- start:939 stop:1238 length:300 start_codon:yes stop_codon:yes gene_type:complete
MKYIQSEDILIMDDIRGFKPSMDSMSGTIEWNNGTDLGKYLYATPNWEGEGQCPVDIYTEEGDFRNVAVLKFSDMSKIDQKKKYREVVSEVIDTILEKR